MTFGLLTLAEKTFLASGRHLTWPCQLTNWAAKLRHNVRQGQGRTRKRSNVLPNQVGLCIVMEIGTETEFKKLYASPIQLVN